jgi:hypothetical protein
MHGIARLAACGGACAMFVLVQGIHSLCHISPRSITTISATSYENDFSLNISNTLTMPSRCFSPFSKYFLRENFSMRDDNIIGNDEANNVVILTIVLHQSPSILRGTARSIPPSGPAPPHTTPSYDPNCACGSAYSDSVTKSPWSPLSRTR